MTPPLKVLLLAPNCDGTDVGEAWCAFKWVESLSVHAEVSLLTLQRAGRAGVSEQLPNVEVVSWPEPEWLLKQERLNAMLKPAYLYFFKKARGWIRSQATADRRFDIAHQLTPLALRYPSPLQGQGIPYVLGPQGGSLPTPAGFRHEMTSDPWFTQLRALDSARLRWDPLLRASYAEASLVLGVAPYVAGLLKSNGLRRFRVMSELGVDALSASKRPRAQRGSLRLLHVGRGVRSKGLRDVVRALALLADLPGVTLDCAGRGPEFETCREEARLLGVEERVCFHGQIPREEVEALYASSDIFVFPSFREPSGSVVFEALRWGLPVIACSRGGPGNVIDESCGRLVPAENPEQLARDLAAAIRRFAQNPDALEPLTAGAHRRVEQIGLWSRKAAAVIELYRDCLRPERLECAA